MSNPFDPPSAGGVPRVAPISADFVRVDVAGRSDQGKVRDANEDAFAIFRLGRFMERVTSSLPGHSAERTEQTGYLMVVADGLGGHEAGDIASATAVANTLEMVRRSPHWALKLDDPETRAGELQAMYERAASYMVGMQTAIRERIASDPSTAGMGTTWTSVYAVGLDLFVMHVGDSKAYLLREGELNQLTRDHTLAQEYADLGMIAQEDVASHRLHHVLTRAVGSHEEAPEADYRHVRAAPGDRLVICSDGLTDMAKEPDIAAVLERNPGCEGACKALLDLALERGGRDNVTVIVADFTDLSPGASS
jgi:protein phosphatase